MSACPFTSLEITHTQNLLEFLNRVGGLRFQSRHSDASRVKDPLNFPTVRGALRIGWRLLVQLHDLFNHARARMNEDKIRTFEGQMSQHLNPRLAFRFYRKKFPERYLGEHEVAVFHGESN